MKEILLGVLKKSKNYKLIAWIFILVILLLIVFYPIIDANFLYYKRVSNRIEILEKITNIEEEKLDENDKLKKQNVVTGKLLWGSYYEVKSGLSEEDYIAFPYGKTVVEGADTKESSSSDYYNS